MAWANLVDDIPTPRRWGWGPIFLRAWRNRGFRAVLLYRLANWAHRHRLRMLRWWLERRLFCSCGAEISAAARIAGGFRTPHPQGIVIAAGAEIGAMVTVQQHVTIGGNFGKTDSRGRAFPRLADMATVCAGAVVAGPVNVGELSVIGANSVVVKDVPDLAVVAGGPACLLCMRYPKIRGASI